MNQKQPSIPHWVYLLVGFIVVLFSYLVNNQSGDNKLTLFIYVGWFFLIIGLFKFLFNVVFLKNLKKNPRRTRTINQEAVCRLADDYDGRIIFMSTCSVYGAQDSVLTESSPTAPLSLYAQTKLESEKCLKHKNAIIGPESAIRKLVLKIFS